MSFQSKGLWMSKDAGCLINGDITYDNASRIEPKRLHQWFMDGGETELFPNKRQAIEVPSSNSFGGISSSTLSPWGNMPNFQSLPNQFGERLFDTDRNIAPVNARNLEMGRKVMYDPFGNSSFDLSISHPIIDPKTCINYDGHRKVKVSEVRDSANLMSMSMSMSMEPSVESSFAREDNNAIPMTHSYGKVDDSSISMGLTYGHEEDAIITIDDPYGREGDNFASLDQSFNKDDIDEISMGSNYKANSNTVSLTSSFGDGENILSMAKNCKGGESFKEDGGKSLVSIGDNDIISMGTLIKGDNHIASMSQTYYGGESLVSMGNSYGKRDVVNRTASLGHSFDKGARNIISFGGCDNDDVSGRLISSCDFVMSQTPISRANTLNHKNLVVSNTDALINTAQGIVSAANTVSEKKDDPKSKKTPPNNFPSNVRSLLSTGILDEVPVKYIAWSQEKELRGVIKGSGYLCGCQSCNFSKVINAYELERHAGCKTKHPNKHIYFANGKTIYGIVQELRSTPQNTLFDVIQTITGSPINQKSFCLWKESFLAATRELQRIYGKDERVRSCLLARDHQSNLDGSYVLF